MIPVGNGRFAIVDASMFDILDRYAWRYCERTRKIQTTVAGANLLMRRIVKNARRGDPPVYHVNGDPFDCRLKNLRYRKGVSAEAVR